MNPIFSKLAKSTPKSSKLSNQTNQTNQTKQLNEGLSVTDDEDEFITILDLKDIVQSIPQTATKQPDSNLSKTCVEWRWRFYNINNRKMIEISKKEPNKERIYMNNSSKWTEYNLDDSFDKFIVDTHYCYVKY